MHPQDLLNFQLVVCLTQTSPQQASDASTQKLSFLQRLTPGTVGWCKTLAQIFTESFYPRIYRNSRLKLFVAVMTNFVPFLNKQSICLMCVCLFLI